MTSAHEIQPPRPIGEPYRADPLGPPPFPTANEPSPTVRQMPPVAETPPVAAAAEKRSPDQRFARFAVWTGISSIFVFNVFIGPLAVVMGFVAHRRGQHRSGRHAMLLGAFGTVIGVVILVLVSEGVLPDLDQVLDDLRKR